MSRTGWASLAAFLCWTSATAALGNTISLATNSSSGWRVQRILVGGESITTAYNGFAVPVQTIPPGPGGTPGVSGAWLTFHDPSLTPYDLSAQWVSWNGLTGAENPKYLGDVSGTQYKYTKTFSMNTEGPVSAFNLSGYMSFDNTISGVTLTANGVPLSLDLTATPNTVNADGFPVVGSLYTVNLTTPYVFNSLTQFVLTVDGVNANGNGSNPGSTGFIYSGSASVTAVPEPATALILGIAAVVLLRRQRRGKPAGAGAGIRSA